jgi:replicative DNA helicase
VLEEQFPPHDIDSEKSLVGALLIMSDVIHDIKLIVSPDDFYADQTKCIFKACLEVVSSGKQIDEITVASQLKANGKLEEIGGGTYLVNLIANCPSPLYVHHYAKIIKELATKRRAISLGSRIVNMGYDEKASIEALTSGISEQVLNFQKTIAIPQLINPDQLAKKTLERYEILRDGKRQGVYTGFARLDEALGGIFEGELVYYAAQPSVGKSEVGVSIARHAGQNFGNVLIANLEQPYGDLMDRLLSQEVGIAPRKIRAGNYSSDLMQKIVEFTVTIPDMNLYLYDCSGGLDNFGATTDIIYSLARQMLDTTGLSLILIDHLACLNDSPSGRSSSYERITYISRRLNYMKLALQVPIICICQLNRKTEDRATHEPQLSDLRDSGNLEYDADIILFHYRPDKYDEEAPKDYAEIIIGKVRQQGELAGQKLPIYWDKNKRVYYDKSSLPEEYTVPSQFT